MAEPLFQPVSSRVHFPSLEEEVLQLWRQRRVFQRTWEEREGRPLFVLYEGPPTANGLPHIGHVLTRIFKDVIPRYKTMRGFRPLRKGGWDTHGLPVELEVEKELGITTKRQIEDYGVERFNQRCRESVFRYVKEWEAMTERVGFWIDLENAYVTYDNNYIESVWWILKQLWDRGLIYRGYRGAPHCPRCVTTLSSHEVAQGYRENTPDPAVYVKFTIAEGPPELQGASILAWTTTPWTLPGNTALAVDPGADYALVEVEGERLVLARALLERALQRPYRVVATFPGSRLLSVRYHPLYHPFEYGSAWVSPVIPARQGHIVRLKADGSSVQVQEGEFPGLYPVVPGDFVSLEEGTGVVHIAPAFGQEDYETGVKQGLFFVQHVDLQGNILGRFPFAGLFVKEADEHIMADLQGRGLLYRRETYYHTYPFCYRCDTPLLYYVKPSWYIRTTACKERMLQANDLINWYPEHIKHGRFGEWLANNVDWAISRERYWGTPLPFWACASCGAYRCVGSVEELRALAVTDLASLGPLDLHRPWVDRVALRCDCGGEMHRVPEVLDVWFDSGAMPFAQWHYPFENASILEDGRFPADYICEAVDQTRGWFYSLHAISTLLTGGPCYRNVICLGLVVDEQGEKMSKSKGNVVEPGDVIRHHGADPLRWYLFTASPPGNTRRFSDALVGETVRRFFLILWNVYAFFVTYANLDRFHPLHTPRPSPTSDLDRWALSELNSLVQAVTEDFESYDPTSAGRRIEAFVDLLSSWYVRRSRRRFWKGQDDEDKRSAYHTLYTCLETVARLMAPLAPFTAEALYQNLVRRANPDAPDSVHLAPWPQADPSLIDPGLAQAMRLAMRVASLARSARSKARLKVRQPLQTLLVKVRSPQEAHDLERVVEQVREEVNVKEVRPLQEETEVVDYTLRPNPALLGPKYGERLPQLLEALSRADQAQLARRLLAGIPAEVEGFTLGPEEVSLEARDKPGYSTASEGGYTVAVTTTLTEELRLEGLARELVHRIQGLRKSAGLEVADRIVVYYQGPEEVQRAMERHADYVKQETLALDLVQGEPGPGGYRETHRVDGMQVSLGLRRAGA